MLPPCGKTPLAGANLSSGKNLSHIVHFGDQQVFENATTYTCLVFLKPVTTAKNSQLRQNHLSTRYWA